MISDLVYQQGYVLQAISSRTLQPITSNKVFGLTESKLRLYMSILDRCKRSSELQWDYVLNRVVHQELKELIYDRSLDIHEEYRDILTGGEFVDVEIRNLIMSAFGLAGSVHMEIPTCITYRVFFLEDAITIPDITEEFNVQINS